MKLSDPIHTGNGFNTLGVQLPELDTKNPREQYDIVSKVAFLAGVSKSIFENEHEPPKIAIYDKLNKEKKARIVRNLCILRTKIEMYFLKICQAIQRENRSIMSIPEYIPTECLQELDNDGVTIYIHLREPNDFLIHINTMIKDRINNCQDIFPDWINWAYLSNIFIMPGGTTEDGIKEAAKFYYDNQSFYPYRQYINWPAEDQGNILYNDKKFVSLLYKWNNDEFSDLQYVYDVSENTKENIYKFIENSEKTVFVVDCENSDPYALCAAIRQLEPEKLNKIEKIMLYDDINAAAAWEMLGSYIDIPVEYELISRLKDNKSLADIKVAAGTCKEFYTNGVDSFVLVSSDSDYWGLIEALPDAHFLVMVEHPKTSHALKDALISKGIFYCYIDDFYVGNGMEIKTDAIKTEVGKVFKHRYEMDLYAIMDEVLLRTRIQMTDEDKKKFIKKYIKNKLSLVFEEDSKISVEYHS